MRKQSVTSEIHEFPDPSVGLLVTGSMVTKGSLLRDTVLGGLQGRFWKVLRVLLEGSADASRSSYGCFKRVSRALLEGSTGTSRGMKGRF